ncbi:MAG: C45 family autoproteolytic acyltransferase/hydrolase [Myxococcota bacterium]
MTAPLDKVVLSGSPDAVGEAHGSLWADEITALARLRTRLTMERSDLPDREALRRLARAHLPVLADFDRDLHAELLAIARGAGVTPEDVVVLNHYTDLRDIRRPEWGPLVEPDGCSVSLVPRRDDALSAQTWDMHGSATPFVRLVEVRGEGVPTATLLTLTGCLGMAGLNEHGVGVLINNLTSTDARVGVVWSALVRRMLRERTAEAAHDVLQRAALGSGHHYLIADAHDAFSVETSGREKLELSRGIHRPVVHTNHCLLDAMRRTEAVAGTSTTWIRFERLQERLDKLRSRGVEPDVEHLAAAYASHEGYPRSLCVHMSSPASPDAVDTCGAVAFDHVARRVLAVRGCCVDHPWVATTVGEDGVEPLDLPRLDR